MILRHLLHFDLIHLIPGIGLDSRYRHGAAPSFYCRPREIETFRLTPAYHTVLEDLEKGWWPKCSFRSFRVQNALGSDTPATSCHRLSPELSLARGKKPCNTSRLATGTGKTWQRRSDTRKCPQNRSELRSAFGYMFFAFGVLIVCVKFISSRLQDLTGVFCLICLPFMSKVIQRAMALYELLACLIC